MINQFTQFAAENKLFSGTERVLLAVSGGMDSMVMWHLFDLARIDYAIIHCNFQLRAEESDADEALVVKTAGNLGIKLYSRRFDTREYAALAGISIEMAARELRYEWFEEVRVAEKFNVIATAHHLDDLLETFFVNLVRKTGLKGLTGFRPMNGAIIRPMLFAGRNEIEQYAAAHQILYRTDRSNSDVAIQRNYIRHKIIPSLEELNQAFRGNLTQTMAHLRSVEAFYLTEVDRQLERIGIHDHGVPAIRVSSLLKLPHPRQVLYEWLSRYGFNSAVADQIYCSLDANPGLKFHSRSHRAVLDRDALLIAPLPSNLDGMYYIERDDLELFVPLHLTFRYANKSAVTIDPSPRKAFLDVDKLSFPLTLKRWSRGSYFQPLGMESLKKISDFFTDQKMSIPDKENTWILYSQEQIVWIVGQRIDHRYRIISDTRQVLCISMEE